MALLGLTILCIFAAAAHAKSTFIINGRDSEIVPSYAYIEIFNNTNSEYFHFGGGSLISTTLVLTVAQNVFGFYRWRVGLGANRISEMDFHKAEEAIIHPDYSSRYLTDNVAIIRLSQPVQLSNTIQIATLLPFGAPFPNQNTVLEVVGFGMGGTEYQPEVLQETEVVVISQENCAFNYPHLHHTQHIDNYFCADSTIQSSICAGDQGGPVYDRQTFLQVGIQSFYRIENCGDPEAQPGAFIRTARYSNWINNVFQAVYDLDSSETIFDQS